MPDGTTERKVFPMYTRNILTGTGSPQSLFEKMNTFGFEPHEATAERIPE
jgi:hypothetical protein